MQETRRVLLYGFAPFGEEPVNPSGEAARALHGLRVGSAVVAAVVLPVTWKGAFRMLSTAWDAVKPAAVLGTGQGKDAFAVEWWAHNLAGTRADNDGAVHGAREVEPGGEARLGVTLDVERVCRAVSSVVVDVPVRASDSAGDYLCNHTLYRALQRASGEGIPSGFLHVPRLAVCPQDVTTRAVEEALRALFPSAGVA